MLLKVALLLTVVGVFTDAADFSADNEKVLREFYSTRNGDKQPWDWESETAAAARLKQRSACPPGFTCPHCNITEIPCLNVSTYCLHYTSCVPHMVRNSCEAPDCECAKGWTTAEKKPGSLQCADDINECAPSNPCQNGGVCTNLVGSYSCSCANGWAGTDCKYASSCALAKCGQNAECFMVTLDGQTYADCRCKPSFSGHPDLGCQSQSSPTVRDATDSQHHWATYGYDPYLVTFDTYNQQMYIGHQDYAIFAYHGQCPVTFCRHRDEDAPNYFNIIVKNYDCASLGQGVCIAKVLFQTKNYNVEFQYDWWNPHPRVRVNNEFVEVSQPIHYPSEKRPVFSFEPLPVYSGQIKMTTPDGLILYVTALLGGIYGGAGDRMNIHLALPLSQSPSWETEGLCGNMNNEKCDELKTPDGTYLPYDCQNPGNSQAAVNAWGDEWAIVNQKTFPEEFKKCEMASGKPGLVTEEDLEWARNMGMCKHLDDKNGVFKDCFQIVNGTIANQLLTACKRDVGIFRQNPVQLDQQSICVQYLQPLAEACRSAELLLNHESKLEWREATECPAPKCRPDETWMTTAPACLDTCDKPFAQSTCEFGSVQEACVCKADVDPKSRLVKRGQNCIEFPLKCPGTRSGKIAFSQEQIVSFLCTDNFMMVKEHGMDKWLRKPMACQPHSNCVAKNGVLDCHCDEGYIGDGRFECRVPQQNCADLQKYFDVKHSGLAPKGVWAMDGAEMSVVCDMETDGGGWTLIQRRVDENSFKKNWAEYQKPFGSLESGSFWLGLDNIFVLTNNSRSQMQLRIDFVDCDDKRTFEIYEYFKIEGPEANYRMHVSGPSGTAGDALTSSHDYDANGCMFTTTDHDNDAFPKNCATLYGGAGWWFSYKCSQSNLNGVYYPNCGGAGHIDTMTWYPGKPAPTPHSYKSVEMKIRPKVFPPVE